MYHTTRTRLSGVAALIAVVLAFAAAPAAAHGGSVAPPTEQQDCRNLALYDNGEGGHAKGGMVTAGDANSTVEWGHCN